MGRGFAYYRALERSVEQNVVFKERKLGMPVLAFGGTGAVGKNLMVAIGKIAGSVEGRDIEDCGHFVMEEQPEEVGRRLLEFFAAKESC